MMEPENKNNFEEIEKSGGADLRKTNSISLTGQKNTEDLIKYSVR